MADTFKGINDYKKYEELSKNPIRMAMLILELQAAFSHYKVHVDPNRRAALLERLKMAAETSQRNAEQGHNDADDILLEFIDDEEVTELYGQVKRWFG